MRDHTMWRFAPLAAAISLGCSQSPEPKPSAQVAPAKAAPGDAATENPELMPVPASTEGSDPDRTAAEAAFAALVSASQDADPDAWTKAEQSLRELGTGAVPTLARHLGDDDPLSREFAVQFLAQLGPDAKGAEAALTESLADSSPIVRVNAAAAMLALNKSTPEAQSVLEDLLTNEDPLVRLPAAISLAGMDATSQKAVAALTELLSAADASIRMSAVEALGRLGDRATRSLPEIEKLAADDDDKVRTAAAKAAIQIEDAGDFARATVPVSGTEE